MSIRRALKLFEKPPSTERAYSYLGEALGLASWTQIWARQQWFSAWTLGPKAGLS